MDRTQTASLLAVVSAYDRRALGESDVLAWHEALSDLDFDECRASVATHYRTSTEWLMPAQVRKLARAATQDQAMRQPVIDVSRSLGGRPAWFAPAVAAFRRGDKDEGERIIAEGTAATTTGGDW